MSASTALTQNHSIVLTSDLPDLWNPGGFADWFDHQVFVLQRPAGDLSAQLAALETPIGFFRAGTVLYASHQIDWVDRAKACFARALESNDPNLVAFSLVRLAGLETLDSLYGLSRFTAGADGIVPLLTQQLERLESLEGRSAFTLEAINKTHQILGDSLHFAGRYAEAELHFLTSIQLSEALGMKSTAERSRAWHATNIFASGRVQASLPALQAVISSASNPHYLEFAVHSYAMSLLELGEDETALQWLEHHEQSPGLRCLALAWSGRAGEEAISEMHLDELGPEAGVNLECLHVLLQQHGQPGSDDLHRIAEIVRRSKEESALWRAYTAFFQSLACLRLGEVQLAAAHFEDMPTVTDEHFSMRALRVGLALEIGLQLHGEIVIPLAQAASQLADLMAGLSRTAQFAIARRFSIFLPLAGAFMAFSPHSNRAFMAASASTVIKLAARISVNGKFLQPIHAGVFGLRAFGLEVEYRPNQRQREEEREATLLPLAGGRLHRFAPIAPAFLAFKYVQVFEASGDLVWQRAARALVNSHGLLPAAKGFEVERRKSLEPVLKALLEGKVSTDDVLQLLEQLR